MRQGWRRLAVLTVFGVVLAAHGAADAAAVPPAAGDQRVLPDVEMTLPGEERVRLSALWRDKPLIVTMFYNHCTGTCSPFLRSLKRAVAEAGGIGEDYRVVTLSFDPNDTPADMQARAKELGIDTTEGWFIGTAPTDSVKQLADAIGFWYRYDASAEAFDHPSQITAVREGRIVRVLLGTMVAPRRFKDLLLEARGIFVPIYPQPGKEALLSCFEVDALTGEARLDWGLLLLLFPGLGALGTVIVVFRRGQSAG